MEKEKILKRMDLAIKQDRERFFKVADTMHLQPKYAIWHDDIENLKQQWRDVTKQNDYPNITHPIYLPKWFPTVNFASSFEKDKYLQEALEREV